jgi:tagatose-6-phosphate ketose/aldose isomerase
MSDNSAQVAPSPEELLTLPLADLKKLGGFETAREIAQQPALWRKTWEIVTNQQKEIKAFLDQAYAMEDVEVVFAGAGTSSFIGDILQGYFEKNTKKRAVSIPTTDLLTHPGLYFQDKNVLLVSFARSGNSPESLAAVNLANELCKNVFHFIITCNANGQLATAKHLNPAFLFLLPAEAEDLSVAMTGSFTSMLLVGLLISRIQDLNGVEQQIESLIRYGEHVINTYTATLRDVADLDFKRAVFLGSGPLQGTAKESALKLQEFTNGKVICKHDSFLGFRHGPKVIINANTLIVYLLSNDAYVSPYEKDLIEAVNKSDGGLYQIGVSESPINDPRLNLNVYFAKQPDAVDEEFLSVCYVLPAQILGFFKALSLSLKPDNTVENGTITRVVTGVNIYPFNKRLAD